MEQQVIVKTSKKSFLETYAALRATIEANPNLKIVLELDHQANAAKKDLVLNATKIIMFGNPLLGTPLMNNNQAIGLDLPQKVLVFEEAPGVVKVSYNNPLALKEKHALDASTDAVLQKIAGALDAITDKAIEA